MKYIIIAVIVLGVILGGIKFTQPTEYTAPEVVEKEVTIEVETLRKRIDAALTASSTEIENEAQKAFEEKRKQLETEVELDVTRKYRAEIEAREAELEEQVSF